MITNETKNVLNKLSNGIILLTLDQKVIFANESVKTFFRGKRNDDLGDFLDCDSDVFKERICKNKTNCDKCFLGIPFKNVLKTKGEEIIEDIKFFQNNYEIHVNCKLTFDLDLNIVILEFLNINNKYEKFNFFMKAFENSRDIVLFKNSMLEYVYINETGKKFFGNKDIIHKTDEELFPEEQAKKCKKADLETLKNGKHHVLEFLGDKVFRTSKESVNGGILAVAQDITQEYFAQISSNVDSLTGLYNRRKFELFYENIFVEKKKNLFLAVIDLDNLRNLNNIHGHLLGDAYLKKLGDILKKYSEGLFFRLGGDEFVALVEGEELEVLELFKKIYNELESLNEKLNPKLSISTGISKIDFSKSKDANFEKVDNILYDVKKELKGKFKIS